jgi:hypothetical protein
MSHTHTHTHTHTSHSAAILSAIAYIIDTEQTANIVLACVLVFMATLTPDRNEKKSNATTWREIRQRKSKKGRDRETVSASEKKRAERNFFVYIVWVVFVCERASEKYSSDLCTVY